MCKWIMHLQKCQLIGLRLIINDARRCNGLQLVVDRLPHFCSNCSSYCILVLLEVRIIRAAWCIHFHRCHIGNIPPTPHIYRIKDVQQIQSSNDNQSIRQEEGCLSSVFTAEIDGARTHSAWTRGLSPTSQQCVLCAAGVCAARVAQRVLQLFSYSVTLCLQSWDATPREMVWPFGKPASSRYSLNIFPIILHNIVLASTSG